MPPMPPVPQIDPQLQVRARDYARRRRRLWLVDLAISALLLAGWISFGWAGALKEWLWARTANDWLVSAGVIAGFGLSLRLASLPLDYYGQYVLAHHYGQSTQTRTGWARDYVLSSAVAGSIALPLLLGLYAIIRAAGGLWWLWAGAGYAAVNTALSLLAPVVIMPLFNRFIPLEEKHSALAQRLTALAERAQTRVAGVFRFDMSRRTRAANAALTGLGRTRRIILGDTLLDAFTPDEAEAVIAHELGHHVNGDIPLFLAFSALASLAGLAVAAEILSRSAAALGLAGPGDIAGLPLLAVINGVFGLAILPLRNAFSRWRERLADRFALEATRRPAAFISAFVRLANLNLTDADPARWVVFMFSTHPPIRERVAMAERFAAEA